MSNIVNEAEDVAYIYLDPNVPASIFYVDKNNIISFLDDDGEDLSFWFFGNENAVRELLEIKLINGMDVAKLEISIAKANEICENYGLPICFELKICC